MAIRNSLIVVVMGLVAEAADALSLGSPQGKVWLGKAIDLGFEVQLDPGMSVESACPQARLISGELPLPIGLAKVDMQPARDGRLPLLRVRSSHLADEPVLKAQVSVGCTGTVTREYTFLADLPPSVASLGQPVAIPWDLPVADTSVKKVVTRASVSDEAEGVRRSPAQPQRAVVDARNLGHASKANSQPPGNRTTLAKLPDRRAGGKLQPKPELKTETAVKVVAVPEAAESKVASASSALSPPLVAPPAPAASVSGRPRLVMEPLVALTLPEEPVARSDSASAAEFGSSQGGALPVETTDSARVQALQAELARMRSQADEDRQATLAMLARLERVNAGYVPASLAYGLAGLLALAMAGATWVMMRMRRAIKASNEEWLATLVAYVSAQSSRSALDQSTPAPKGSEARLNPRGAGSVPIFLGVCIV